MGSTTWTQTPQCLCPKSWTFRTRVLCLRKSLPIVIEGVPRSYTGHRTCACRCCPRAYPSEQHPNTSHTHTPMGPCENVMGNILTVHSGDRAPGTIQYDVRTYTLKSLGIGCELEVADVGGVQLQHWNLNDDISRIGRSL